MKKNTSFQKRRALTAIFVAAAMVFSSSIAMADTVLLTTDENLVGVYNGNDNGVDDLLGKFDDEGDWDGNSVDGIENVEIQNGGQDAVFDVTTSILLAQLSVKASNRYALYNIPSGTLYAGTTYAVTSQHLVNDGGQQPDISHVSFFGSGDPVPEGEEEEEEEEEPGDDDPNDPGDDPGSPRRSSRRPSIPLGAGTEEDLDAIALGIPRTGDANSLSGLFLIVGGILLVGAAVTVGRKIKG